MVLPEIPKTMPVKLKRAIDRCLHKEEAKDENA
jgi:hypothetical protein